MTELDVGQLKRLLGCFAAGVTVVTTRDPGGRPVGMTVSAVASVSLDPPLLLVCIGRGSAVHAAMTAAEFFAINILSAGQSGLSRQFSQDRKERFKGVKWSEGVHGIPLLEGVVAQIVCRSWSSFEAGDHTVFFGLIEQGDDFDHPPLIHFRSRYSKTHTP